MTERQRRPRRRAPGPVAPAEIRVVAIPRPASDGYSTYSRALLYGLVLGLLFAVVWFRLRARAIEE